MMAKVTQAHVDARRADILEAAMELFATRGSEQTSMQEVAAAAGLSTGAIYRYFASKDDLLREVFEETTANIRATFADESAKATSPLDAIKRVGRRVLTFEDCGDPAMHLATTLGSKQDPEHWGLRHRAMTLDTLAQLEVLVRAGQDAGEINPALDPAATAQLLYMIVPGTAALWTELGESPDIDRLMETVGQLLTGCQEGGPA